MSVDAVFVRDRDRFNATELALGPWAEGALHGGAVAALVVHALEGVVVAPGLHLARLTCEFVRPVPIAGLAVAVGVVRPGRRVTLLDAVLRDGGDVEVCRARALLLVPSELDATFPDDPPPPFPGPEAGTASDFVYPDRRMFATDAMEIRFVAGSFRSAGPATAWFRLRFPVVAGSEATPMQRLAAAADFGNGIGSALPWETHAFINPDLTVSVEREPVGEWVALESRTRVVRGSVAAAESVLWDERGRVGHALQSLLVSRAA